MVQMWLGSTAGFADKISIKVLLEVVGKKPTELKTTFRSLNAFQLLVKWYYSSFYDFNLIFRRLLNIVSNLNFYPQLLTLPTRNDIRIP